MTLEATVVATSLKMYFSHERTMTWLDTVAELDIPDGVEFVILPSFLSIPGALDRTRGTRIAIGGQNLAEADAGPFTGEVSGAQLRELGCRFVEVGHAERERLFGETEADVAGKLAAAWRNGLCPVLCIGEPDEGPPHAAARWCAERLARLLEAASPDGGDLIVAYEPVWAIGAAEPASVEHVRTVALALREIVDGSARLGSARVIYGGAAGAGLLTRLDGAVDGLFLGRFAHDPEALRSILVEAAAA